MLSIPSSKIPARICEATGGPAWEDVFLCSRNRLVVIGVNYPGDQTRKGNVLLTGKTTLRVKGLEQD